MNPAQSSPARWANLGILLVWLAALALVFAASSLPGTDVGDALTRNTVRLALVFYAGAALLMLLLTPTEWTATCGRGRLARWCWTLGYLSYLVHLAMAFHFYHHWSHTDAVEHTRAVSGWGGGIYFSHLFTLLWGADVLFWWLRPERYAERAPWIGRVLHGYLAFIIFNGTVVYEQGPIRWAGLGLFLGLGLVLLMRTAIRRRALATVLGSLTLAVPTVAAQEPGLRLAPGFRITLYADENLANDIFAMTLDTQGRPVVTSSRYIKTLHDTKGTGRADRATLFATTPTGGMGMCFDGNDLYFCGDGWFSVYRDRNGDGKADGPPERFIPLAFAEHGGHAMRRGPDGYWYLIGGNDSGIGRDHVTAVTSPIRDPQAGALLRLTPDCRHCEVIAHGLRNPYDFDFNPAGDIFTYDSDVERDYFLPWYTPTRIYHIAYAGHHGWRLPSYLRSWCRRDDYLDTVDILWPVGRGSPTGVTCYRHTQFPEHYRGGIFALDWTFGKVYFFPLEPNGASYRTQPEIFLESTGTSGFDPTDIAVAPDGSLFLSMGGRGTRGAVYHIEYVGKDRTAPRKPASDLDAVLHAPQPLDAWSRARWMPVARRLGREPFAAALRDAACVPSAGVRAVEVLTELFGGLPEAAAQAGARAASPLVRSRVAWSLGRIPRPGGEALLLNLAEDADAHARRCALEALADHAKECDPERVRSILPSNLGHTDKRVRQAAARLAALLPQAAWQELVRQLPSADVQTRLTAALAMTERQPHGQAATSVIDMAVKVLGETQSPALAFQAMRLIVIALGDYHLHNPPVELYTAYDLAQRQRASAADVRRILEVTRPLFPSTDTRLSEEVARLLAMLEDDDAGLPHKVAARWSADTSPTSDMHYLIVLSRLRGPRDSTVTTATASTLLGLHHKLEGREQRIKQVWGDRLAELMKALLKKDPHLGDELLRQPNLVRPGHVVIAAALEPARRRQAARLFLETVRKDPAFNWSEPLIELLSQLPREEVLPVFRAHWSEFGLRDALLVRLAEGPEQGDREKFQTGLDSQQPAVVKTCLTALEQLPGDATPETLLPVLRLLHRLEQEPRERALRQQALAFLAHRAGQTFTVREKASDAAALRQAYQPVFTWFAERYPSQAAALSNTDGEDPAFWDRLLRSVDWSRGDAARGEVLFRDRACQICHSGGRALGPDLTGVTNRFSRADLFTAILYPSKDVAPAYRTTVIEAQSGQVQTGIIAFESADGIILQTGATTTLRIGTPDIAGRSPGTRSLMPNGLLKDLKPADLADLYRYLQTLQPKSGS